MAVKRAAPKPGPIRPAEEPTVVQPGRVPQPGDEKAFQQRIAGAGDDGAIEVRSIERHAKPFALPEPEVEVRRWTSVRDARLDEREALTALAAAGVAPVPEPPLPAPQQASPPASAPLAAASMASAAASAARTEAGMKPGLTMGDDLARVAAAALADALARAIGRANTSMQSPQGRSFALDRPYGPGECFAPRGVTLPLPQGHATSHAADVAIELETGALLLVDVFAGSGSLQELKANAYDALQLRRLGRAFGVLVFVRLASGGLQQGQVEAIGHGYDVVFGVDEARVHSVQAYGALVERIKGWCQAASRA